MPRPIRFVHAADLHLGQPIRGVTDAAEPLVDVLIDAPLQAAARVFDAAIDQRVDFVVLAGDVINSCHCAPRDWLFLSEQFQRLAQHNIVVYWSGGPSDSLDKWPSYCMWPSNVRMFPRGRVERHRHEIAGATVCEIMGRGHDETGPPRPYDFVPATDQFFSIAVAHADWNAGALGDLGVNYWALGGSHQRLTPLESRCVAHVAGSPQGRCSSETGPHGCSLITVDESMQISVSPISCDVARWISPQLSLSATADRHGLDRLLQSRAEQLRSESPDVYWLVTWTIACRGALRSALQHGELKAELVSRLRSEFSLRTSRVWTVGIEVELPEPMPLAWSEEESLRGDFLRAVRELGPNVFAEGTLGSHLMASDMPAEFVDRFKSSRVLEQTSTHRQMLREASWLGADLLGSEEEAS